MSSLITSASVAAEMRKDPLVVVTASGRYEFTVEVADNPADKALGLMFRQSLAKRDGMLFPYDRPIEITMWMKNTYISLDMIFIKKSGQVHRIARATEPFSEEVIASQGDVSGVLEVAAGVADAIGLKVGDQIKHAFFGN